MKFEQISRIENSQVYYLDNVIEKKIVLKESADSLYDMFHKVSFWNWISRKKQKNIYAGTKDYSTEDIAYIVFYNHKEEYRFELDNANPGEKRKEWEYINMEINKQGYWLLDLS